jgi:ubiquinone/menaquinone biosynthesis C-methylase UbiE
VENVRRVIAANFLRRNPCIRILDAGCDTSGRQLWYLKQLTRGEVVGINIPQDFPTAEAVAIAGPGSSMIRMDGMNLTFPDESFDLVVSANVMEHVADTQAYISECARVLKPNGVAYFETAPIWTSARGHHIHEDMVKENCPSEKNYRNDGSIIPDFSHLVLTQSEMRYVLTKKLLPKTCDYILSYLYQSDDLNKTPWSVINAAFRDTFPHIKIHHWDVNQPDAACQPPDDAEDHSVFGFAATGRKQKQNGIARRLIWRLRRIGL